MSLKDDIKSIALESGFHAVGVAGVTDESRLIEAFPAARSIISVALSYLTDDMEEPQPNYPPRTPRGWMARFSRGLDYHNVMQERLLTLTEEIRTRIGKQVELRSFADTGPLVDRSVAIRAGIGSRGKNTCIYVADYKSWVVLGELVLDLELEPDEPADLDICGECDECIKACPTGALSTPYTVDRRLCLSQVTQSKGIIPPELREKLGTRIYGCDTCQSACPLNKDAKPGNIDAFRPSSGLGKNPGLLPLLNITSIEFKQKVAPTTAGWIRRTRFRRNVALALGNIADPIAVPALTETLNDPEPLLRAHAAWALGRIGTKEAHTALERVLGMETDDVLREEVRCALGGLPGNTAVFTLVPGPSPHHK